MSNDQELNRLLHDMANQTTTPDALADQARRRQRAIGGMRAVQRGRSSARAVANLRRRYVVWSLVAAIAALCGSAMAGAAGWLNVGWHDRTVPAPRVVTTPAKPSQPALRSPVAAQQPIVAAPQPIVAAPQPIVAAPQPIVATRETEPAPVTTASPGATPKMSADLEQVNRLFAEAKRARREQRDADGLKLVERLLAEHPGSVLAPEASIERFRALARLGRNAEAARSANTYLARYPNGYAAEEARRIAGRAAP